MNTTQRHFLWFQQCITKWMRICSLGDWDVYYRHIDCGEYFAKIRTNVEDKTIDAMLNTTWPEGRLPLNKRYIDAVACHEVVHIRTAKLDTLARHRYVREGELDAAEEELVVWITKLLLGEGNK